MNQRLLIVPFIKVEVTSYKPESMLLRILPYRTIVVLENRSESISTLTVAFLIDAMLCHSFQIYKYGIVIMCFEGLRTLPTLYFKISLMMSILKNPLI